MKEGKTTPRAGPGGATPQRGLRDFDEAVLCHIDLVYRIALRLSGDSHEAEDLVQETFLRAHQAFGRFELREYGTKPWLLKILHNVFFSRREQAGRLPVRTEDIGLEDLVAETGRGSCAESGFPDGEGGGSAPTGTSAPRRPEVNWEDFDEELKAAVESLPPDYRSVVLLWALGDLSYQEIAEVLDCAIGTVMSRLYRARQQLSSALRGYAAERGVLRKPSIKKTKE